MFGGIIKHLGKVADLSEKEAGAALTISMPGDLSGEVGIGDSVAVNGCCLTIEKLLDGLAQFSLGPVTKKVIAPFSPGETVHLEPSLKIGDQLGGHFVTGHVDCSISVVDCRPEGDSLIAAFKLPEGFEQRLVVAKGSVAIAGVSLTVSSMEEGTFSIQLIPHTIAQTLLNKENLLQAGKKLNFEADYLARHALRG